MNEKPMAVHEVVNLTGITARTLHYYDEMNQLKEVVRIMKRTEEQLDAKQILSVIEKYSLALELLDAYDHQNMKRP